MKAREIKRAKMVARYAEKRAALKKIVNTGEPAEAYEAAQKLQAIPRNANPSACITVARLLVVPRAISACSVSHVFSSVSSLQAV